MGGVGDAGALQAVCVTDGRGRVQRLAAVAREPRSRKVSIMEARAFEVDSLSADERIELMGRLWDSLDPAVAAPISAELGAELDRREAEADDKPEAGDSWADIHLALARKLR